MQVNHHGTIDSTQNNRYIKINCFERLLNVFAFLTLLAVGSLIFIHILYLQNNPNPGYGTDFKAPNLLPKQRADENRPATRCEIDGMHTTDCIFMAQDSDIEEPSLIISEFMAINGSKQPLEAGELLDEDGDSSDWIEIYFVTFGRRR